jgi:cell wall-associated NlpC family hydrolase
MPPVPTSARTAPNSDAPLDARVNAWRADLADVALRGRVSAERFVAPRAFHLRDAPSLMMHAAPAVDAVAVSELLFGERFDVVDIADGWAWGYAARDRYVGYVPADLLAPGAATATHRVVAKAALAFAGPDIKTRVLRTLPMNARLTAEDHDDRFVRTDAGEYVHRRHVANVADVAADPVAVALAFIGTPYKWGGRTYAGIDCSGLVQMALDACGIACPRDSDMQAGALGTLAGGAPRRGDLVFFPGHVGIMADARQLLHANAFHMATVVEPLDDVIARLRPSHADPVRAVRRL